MADQKLQEAQYILPYHWNFAPDSFRGRTYHGYIRLALELAGELRNKAVLDAGCGDGYLSHVLQQQGARVTGIDYSDQAIALAKNLVPQVDFAVVDLTVQPLEPIYDVIFLIEVLEHIDPNDATMFLKNLAAGLKPDGTLIISVPSILQKIIDKHYRHFSVELLQQVLSSAGLEIERIIGQEKMRMPLRVLYKLFDNRFYDIKLLRKWFNLKLYPRFQNSSALAVAGRLIARVKKV